jgi:hypothetical protein
MFVLLILKTNSTQIRIKGEAKYDHRFYYNAHAENKITEYFARSSADILIINPNPIQIFEVEYPTKIPHQKLILNFFKDKHLTYEIPENFQIQYFRFSDDLKQNWKDKVFCVNVLSWGDILVTLNTETITQIKINYFIQKIELENSSFFQPILQLVAIEANPNIKFFNLPPQLEFVQVKLVDSKLQARKYIFDENKTLTTIVDCVSKENFDDTSLITYDLFKNYKSFFDLSDPEFV